MTGKLMLALVCGAALLGLPALAQPAGDGTTLTPDDAAAALSLYGSNWLAQNGAGQWAGFRTEDGEWKWDRELGLVYVCPAVAATCPLEGDSGSLVRMTLTVSREPGTGRIRCEASGGPPGLVMRDTLRALFPDAPPGSTETPQPIVPDPWGPKYTGTWTTNWGTMYITQSGDRLTANYVHDTGRLDGPLSGRTIRGTWAEAPTYAGDHDAGGFVFTFGEDGKSFTGTWGYGADAAGAGAWSGTLESSSIDPTRDAMEKAAATTRALLDAKVASAKELLADPAVWEDPAKRVALSLLLDEISAISSNLRKLADSYRQ